MNGPKPLSTRPMRIAPRLDRRGTQLAGWSPHTRNATRAARILFDADVPIALPDGTVLVAASWLEIAVRPR
jgi:hypothetical protein